MRKKLLLGILILLLFFPLSKSIEEIPTFSIIKNQKEKAIATISIKKIKLKQPLYKINSPNNTIEKNVTILKESILPEKENSIVFLAAHSGTGKIAYFDKLNLLQINDEIIFTYQNKKYKYQIIEIWEEKKTGYININKTKEKQLVLTTCSPTNKNNQLIINSIQKESLT